MDYPVVVEWDSLSSVALATRRHPDGEVCGHIIIPDSSVAGKPPTIIVVGTVVTLCVALPLWVTELPAVAC